MSDGLEDSQSGLKTLRTVSIGTVIRLFRYPFVFLSMAVIPRLMGDENYGQYAYFLSLFGILEFFSDAGITQVMGRFIPPLEAEGKRDQSIHLFHGVLLYSMVFTAVIVAVSVLVRIYFYPDFPLYWLAMMCAILVLSQFEGVVFAYIYGLNRIAQFSSKEIMRSAFTFISVLIGYLLYDLRGAFAGLVVNEIMLSIVGTFLLRKRLFSVSKSMRISHFSHYIFFGLKCYIPIMIYGAMLRTGNLFVKWLTDDPSQVAYFDIANQFMVLCGSFFALIISSLLPSLSGLHHRGQFRQVDTFHQNALQLSWVFAVTSILTLIWIGYPAIGFFLGADFLPVYGNAVLVSPAIISMIVIWIGINYTIVNKSPHIYALGMACGCIVMLSSFALLIPPFKSAGAAIGALIGFSSTALFFAIYYSSNFRIVFKGAWKVLLAGLPFAALYLLVPLRRFAWLAYPIFIGIYFIILTQIGILTKEKLAVLVSAFKKDSIEKE